jgi:predicted protein tyrosine phosphatase
MPSLHVCPLSRLAETLARTGAARLVTIATPGSPVPRRAGLRSADHLVLEFGDIAVAREGHVLAANEHLDALLYFVRSWDRGRPMLIHCYAGISRSTAAAYIAACALAPGRCEAEVARALRRAAPSATPNPRLVALADACLGRDGRMVGAIAAIGRGAEAYEGTPFAMPLGPVAENPAVPA